MIMINNKVFTIISKYDPVVLKLQELDPDYIELKYWDTMIEVHKTTTGWWYISLDTAEAIYGPITWVSPD